MSSYSTSRKDYRKTMDLTELRPYGDTLNDGKIQLSFTLPVKLDDRAVEAARKLVLLMGVEEPVVAVAKSLDENFAFFVIYGSVRHGVDYTSIEMPTLIEETMTMEEVDACIGTCFGRKLVVVGASTGTDAHTVGIDAIMNMKGYAGHYGLERFRMIDAYNLGSQVGNSDLIREGMRLQADVYLVSQTVTQNEAHIKNLKDLVEMAKAEGIREKVLLICGGPRIDQRLAMELGYDAGFGSTSFADDVATFIVEELRRRSGKG